MANYFTRRNEQAAARLWQELLQLLLAAAAAAASPQLYHLADGSAAALVQQYPQDRVRPRFGNELEMHCCRRAARGRRTAEQPPARAVCPPPPRCWLAAPGQATARPLAKTLPPPPPQPQAGWHRGSCLLHLAKLVPWGKWRALREALVALDRQKAAFRAAHGPFLHLAAVAVAPSLRSAGLGSVLLDHICRLADQKRQPVYAEVTSDRVRGWLKRHGFAEAMRHSVRPHAPPVYVLVRWPAPAAGGAGNGAAVAGSGSNGAQQGQQAAQQQVPQRRPSGSVRSR